MYNKIFSGDKMTKEIKTKIKAAIIVSMKFKMTPELVDTVTNAVANIFDEEFANALQKGTEVGEILNIVGLEIVSKKEN
jgi:adenosine deaminase